MQVQEKARDNSLWIEITDQKGFLVLGDLSRYQRAQGVNLSNNEVDIICSNCPHKYRFSKQEIEGKGKIWDFWKWRVFLRGNQLSKGRRDYFVELSVEIVNTFYRPRLIKKV